MRKLTLAATVLASLGGALATSAIAAPGAPIGVAAPETGITNVMSPMEHRMMRRHMERRMERRMMRRHMERRMMRREMMHRM